MSRNPRRMMDYQPHHQQQQRPSLSPWEGGFAPGGAGLLPTPSSLLNQFSSTEAQLAVASNLLSSLLRPSQSSMQSNQVPSLMGMGGSGGNYESYGQSMYHDNYPSRGPYLDAPPQQRRSFEYRNRSPVRNAPPKRTQQQSQGRPRQAHVASGARPQRPDNNEQQPYKREPQVKKDGKPKDSGEKRGVAFEGLPKAAFHCHMCKKNMWDPLSFDNHVRGVAHQKMLGERERGYLVKAELIRHEAKLEEQQNQIEMERLLRMGKKIVPGRREFCKMCDFAFFGDLANHRKSKFHQNLKNFLHPKCQACHKEFPLRIELDRHLLTPEHLKKVFKDKMTTPAKVEGEEGEKMEVEEVVLNDSVTEAEAPEDAEMASEEVADLEKGTENGDEQPAEEQKEENGEVTEEKGSEAEKVQTYNPDVAVGEEFLMPVTGMFCKACRRFFMHEDQSLQSHCRTLGHFNNCVALKAQLQTAVQSIPEVKKEVKKVTVTSESSTTGSKRVQTDGDTQKVKRAKSEELQDTSGVKEELYDPLETSPPTPEPAPEPASTAGSEVDKKLDELVAVINEKGEEGEAKQAEGEETPAEGKEIVEEEEEALVTAGDKGSPRARRGRSTRARGRGKV